MAGFLCRMENLKYEGNYIQGNPDGEHIFYYPNGQIKGNELLRYGYC